MGKHTLKGSAPDHRPLRYHTRSDGAWVALKIGIRPDGSEIFLGFLPPTGKPKHAKPLPEARDSVAHDNARQDEFYRKNIRYDDAGTGVENGEDWLDA